MEEIVEQFYIAIPRSMLVDLENDEPMLRGWCAIEQAQREAEAFCAVDGMAYVAKIVAVCELPKIEPKWTRIRGAGKPQQEEPPAPKGKKAKQGTAVQAEPPAVVQEDVFHGKCPEPGCAFEGTAVDILQHRADVHGKID